MTDSPAATFRLQSLSGGPTHVYDLESGEHLTKSAIYRRKDNQKLSWHEEFGWSTVDEKSGQLVTVVWGVPSAKQGNSPPEGVYVSRKNEGAFVYDGKFAVSAADKKAQAQRYREAIGGVEM